jgi:hypothetical protein
VASEGYGNGNEQGQRGKTMNNGERSAAGQQKGKRIMEHCGTGELVVYRMKSRSCTLEAEQIKENARARGAGRVRGSLP